MITKSDAVAKLTEEETREMAQWEATIDKKLETFSGRECVQHTMSSRVCARVVEAYQKNGWHVETGDSQRDGSWLTFT